ncbi:DMT family protein [Paracoccus sp. PAMC 22219]|uniref:DMT family protein n=1 Tax=Paracoccus sp. PAMC 22219 TaxID=1569209 RepID=UPI0005A965E0|nr:DMT family protein [Paracoccus sp. PAMC 22219]
MGLNLPIPVVTIGLLIASNVFMTIAWYGHLKFKTTPLVTVIAISWFIALFEYIMQVPANRIGHGYFTAAQLKTIQEVISLSVFAIFSWLYLGEKMGWQHGVGFSLIFFGAWFIFHDFG